MKYIVLLGDGMADDPQDSLGGRTPLEAAHTPNMDRIAACGRIGLTRTVPENMEPGSDVANLAVLGFEPQKHYTGRAAIEAAAMGITLGPGQAAFRMNLVSFGGDDENPTMADYSAGHPDEKEQKAVLDALSRELEGEGLRIYPGVGFRNLCIASNFDGSPDLKPPHDHAGEYLKNIAPSGPGSELIAELQHRARKLLKDHPVNLARAESGKPPISGIWLWGTGRAGTMPTFHERHGLSAAVITGVDLVRGLGRMLGMEIINVPGATGYVDTNYQGKARAALQALERVDFVFLHVEAPDEAAHEGDLELKVRAIEDFDQKTAGTVLEGLSRFDEAKVMVLPDHETPLAERGHRGGPVPFAVASSSQLSRPRPGVGFSEKCARQSGDDPVSAPSLLESVLFS